MNFFRRLINKIRTKNKIENKIENQIKNSKEKTDFTSEIYCNIAEMKLGLENIKSETEYTELKSLIESLEKYIEESSNILEERTIEDKVNRIINESNIIVEIKLNPEVPQLTMDKVNQELAIEDYYKRVKEMYKLKYQKATQKILMKKAERINNSFDLIGDKISLEELKSYLEILVQKKEEFTGTMQNKYIEILAEIEYKISMLEGSLETAMEISKKVENSRVKEIIWSKLFIADVEKFISESDEDISKDLKEMLEKRKLQGKTDKIFTEQNIESYFLAKKNEEKYIENKKIAESLDMASRILEREKSTSENSSTTFKTKLKESTNENSSTSFQDAISDQKKLAKELGLADEKNFLETDDIKVYKRREEELPLICDYLKGQGEYYEIYREIDEFHNVYIVTSKEAEIDYEDRDIVLCNADEQIGKELVPITKEFAQLYSKMKSIWFDVWDEGTIIRKGTEYYLTKKTYNSEFELCVGGMLYKYEVDNYSDDPDYDPTSTISDSRVGKFNIEIPYKRSIIPILEKLKEEEIEFTIPPINFNEEIQLKNPAIKIYMDFEDLEKYKDKVHNEISTPEKGIIKICGNNQDTEYHYMMFLIMKGIKYKHKEKIMRMICMQNYPDKPYSKDEEEEER